MHIPRYHRLYLGATFSALLFLRVASQPQVRSKHNCRYLPGDCEWPSDKKWNRLNDTTGGKLIRSTPLAEACYLPTLDLESEECNDIRNRWTSGETYYEDPVHIMSPYWLNGSCSPFPSSSSSCSLGNIAVYALEIDGPDTVKAGLSFAQENNIRLTIKNTGHDYLGRASGRGSLALWTHKLKNIEYLDYSSPRYSGPALRIGAGAQSSDVYSAADALGLRVAAGSCPSVGFAGGYVQGGGHGPLSATYGLAADNTLEFEVVTTDGRHLTASPTKNSDLYWALSGGGAGTYAVVLSVVTRAHTDGPTAGATMAFLNTDSEKYWDAISAFQSHLLLLDQIPGFAASWGFDNQAFSIDVATLSNGTRKDIEDALDPFIGYVESIGLSLAIYNTTVFPRYYGHFQHYQFPPEIYSTNNALGGRLISRSAVKEKLPRLIDAYRVIAEDTKFPLKRINGITLNVTQGRTSLDPGRNSVLPAWRNALYTMNFGVQFNPNISSVELRVVQKQMNEWQDLFSPITPRGGAYVSEATFDNPNWKEDYYGKNYDRLLEIKRKYDPDFVLWQHTSVGSDAYWKVAADGRLCRIS